MHSSDLVVGFKIFEIAPKNKKVTFYSISVSTPKGYTVGALGCLQVPRGTNWGPMGYEKISYVHIVFK